MLLLDADILVYKVGFMSQEETEAVAISSLNGAVANWAITSASLPFGGGETMELFLSGKTNFRTDVNPDYKATRKGKDKPVHFEALFNHLVDSWGAAVSDGEEADDMVGIRSTQLGEDCLIITIDKDYDQLPGWHYNPDKKLCYHVDPWEGLQFFYRQILTGDRVDNIIGLHRVGEKTAAKMLEACETEEELYNNCVAAYMEREGLTEGAAKIRVEELGQQLWLRRKPNEMWRFQ